MHISREIYVMNEIINYAKEVTVNLIEGIYKIKYVFN